MIFGDATDPEMLAHLPLKQVAWAVSAVPEHDTGITHDDPRRSLIGSLRDLKFEGRIAVSAHSEETADKLEAAGADLVLMPFRDAATRAAALVLSGASPPIADTVDPDGQKEFAA